MNLNGDELGSDANDARSLISVIKGLHEVAGRFYIDDPKLNHINRLVGGQRSKPRAVTKRRRTHGGLSQGREYKNDTNNSWKDFRKNLHRGDRLKSPPLQQSRPLNPRNNNNLMAPRSQWRPEPIYHTMVPLSSESFPYLVAQHFPYQPTNGQPPNGPPHGLQNEPPLGAPTNQQPSFFIDDRRQTCPSTYG